MIMTEAVNAALVFGTTDLPEVITDPERIATAIQAVTRSPLDPDIDLSTAKLVRYGSGATYLLSWEPSRKKAPEKQIYGVRISNQKPTR